MSISTYDQTIAPHLNAAREYAYRATREISRLPARPAFFTLAKHELETARKTLEATLEAVKSAEALYEAKPLENA
jgi:predicted translin family RNA/ssDNA-binding protein